MNCSKSLIPHGRWPALVSAARAYLDREMIDIASIVEGRFQTRDLNLNMSPLIYPHSKIFLYLYQYNPVEFQRLTLPHIFICRAILLICICLLSSRYVVVYDRKLFRCFFGRTVRPKVLPKLFGQKFEIFNRTEPSAEPASFCRTSQFRPKSGDFGRKCDLIFPYLIHN